MGVNSTAYPLLELVRQSFFLTTHISAPFPVICTPERISHPSEEQALCMGLFPGRPQQSRIETRPSANQRQLKTATLTTRCSVLYIIPLDFVSCFRITIKLDYSAYSILMEGF